MRTVVYPVQPGILSFKIPPHLRMNILEHTLLDEPSSNTGLIGHDNRDKTSLVQFSIENLNEIIQDKHFDNLPLLLKTIRPYFKDPTLERRANLLEITQNLIEKSPSEATAFLISIQQDHPSPEIERLMKKILPNLPQNLKE